MAVVILNLQAGGGRAAAIEGEMRDWLHRHHPRVPVHATHSSTEARQVIARCTRGARIVIVGGDGSVHQSLHTLLEGGHELALVPAGSGDDSARALGLAQMSWQRAMSRALLAPSQPMDVGYVRTEHEERPFFSSLAAGFDAAVAQRALDAPRWLRGLPRYLLATLQEVMSLRTTVLRVEADDKVVHQGAALFASTLNTPTYGGGMRAMPRARLDDGQLDLLLARAMGRARVLALLPRLLIGRHLSHRCVRHVPFRKLVLQAEKPLPLAADGEPMEDARQVTVRVGQHVLHVVPGSAFVQLGRRASSSRTSRTTSLSKVSTE